MKLSIFHLLLIPILINTILLGVTLSLAIFIFQTSHEDNKAMIKLTDLSYRLDRKIDNTTKTVQKITEDDADFNIMMLNNMSGEIQQHENRELKVLQDLREERVHVLQDLQSQRANQTNQSIT